MVLPQSNIFEVIVSPQYFTKKITRFLTIDKVGLGLSCPPRPPNPAVPVEHRGRPLPSDNLLMTILSLQNMTAIIYGMMERFKIIFESFLINNHQRKLLTVDPFGLLFIGNLYDNFYCWVLLFQICNFQLDMKQE